MSGTIDVEMSSIKEAGVDKKTGKTKVVGTGTTKEDWTSQVDVGDLMHVKGLKLYKARLIKMTAPKYAGSGVKSKLIFGVLEFEFLSDPPTVDEPAATVCKLVIECVIPRIPEQTKLDDMVRNRFLSGDTSGWDVTSFRQGLNDLEPRTSGRRRLLTMAPSITRTKTAGRPEHEEYEEANRIYTDAHAARKLNDADYVEWIASIRNHQQHHADGRLHEAEYNHASCAAYAFIEGVTCLTDEDRAKLRDEIRTISV